MLLLSSTALRSHIHPMLSGLKPLLDKGDSLWSQKDDLNTSTVHYRLKKQMYKTNAFKNTKFS